MYIQVLFDVASKLRQLIEQLFEISMSEHREFTIQQIVWATVDQYPPWPAKIVRKMSHNGKTVYKVNFFGDPTYCYLHQHSLQLFNNFETTELLFLEQNMKLKRAFELAKFSFSKQFDQLSELNNQSCFKVIQIPNLPIALEQTHIQSKDNIDLPQKTQQFQISSKSPANFDGLLFDSISPSNVVQLLYSYQEGQIAQRLENLKRKQIICFQNHLKQNLLLKYKLNAVDFLKIANKPNQTIANSIKDVRISKKEKKKNQLPKFQQKELCIRKIQKILFQKGMNRHISFTTSIKIIEEIEKRSQNTKLGNLECFRQNIIRTIQQISSNMQQIQQVELEYIQKHILSYIDIEFHQNKLEQGSRMTQINEQFCV